TQQAFLVANGKALSVDTVAKRVTMKVEKMLFHDENVATPVPKDLLMDVSIAAITRDTGAGKLSDVKVGANIVAVSYTEVLKNIMTNETDNLASLMVKLPKPAPIDEIKIMESEEQKKERQNEQAKASEPFNWVRALWIGVGVIAFFALLLFSLPWLIWLYLNNKAKSNTEAKAKAYHIYTAATYYLNQMGVARVNESPQQFASTTDNRFGSNFNSFTNVYQKVKYSTAPLTANEDKLVQGFYSPFIKQVKNSISAKKRVGNFLNIYNTLHFFTKTKIS
ncbi:MAG TPA: hypothetical protein VF610_12320, partial [Segetibacter sp.]